LVFDAGVLPTPPDLLNDWLADFDLPIQEHNAVKRALTGLSLKACGEIVALAKTRGALNARNVREMRTMVYGVTPGLASVDTLLDFYDPPDELANWLKINAKHFTAVTKYQLVPRGLLFDGPPGTGKTAAAKHVANELQLPLYRLDIVGTLGRWVGESEKQVARVLNMAERESPCVILLDEVEKLFTESSDTGVTQRILSQLLWWLAEHRSRVFTIMTTNDRTKIVPELYRPGRIDKVIRVHLLGNLAARQFGAKVFKAVVQKSPSLHQVNMIDNKIGSVINVDGLSHGAVQQLIYDLIKTLEIV